jgi:hypothetical protein
MRDASVDLWATDEVHFQQHGSRCRMWIPPEIKDPVLLHAPNRKSGGYFAAVRSRDGRFVFRRENRNIQRGSFFHSPATPLRQPRNRQTGCGHPRQRPLSPLSAARALAGKERPPCFVLPSPLQSRTQSDRASVEAHTPSLHTRPLLREPQRRDQRG